MAYGKNRLKLHSADFQMERAFKNVSLTPAGLCRVYSLVNSANDNVVHMNFIPLVAPRVGRD